MSKDTPVGTIQVLKFNHGSQTVLYAGTGAHQRVRFYTPSGEIDCFLNDALELVVQAIHPIGIHPVVTNTVAVVVLP